MVWKTLIELARIIIYPGIITLILLAFFYEWVDRRYVARLQNRCGPIYVGPFGILQPIADFIKLLSKEDITPEHAEKKLFAIIPIMLFASTLTALMCIPIFELNALVSFEGDILLVFFMIMFSSISIFLGGISSLNRFSLVGSVRTALQMLAYEIPMGLAIAGPAIISGSLSITKIVFWQSENTCMIILQPLGFIIFILCAVAELEKVPFDAPLAETELVAGWETEFSGKKLALIKISEDLSLLLFASLMSSLFLGGPYGLFLIPPTLCSLLKITICVLIISTIRALFARFRIDQAVRGFWKIILPLAILQIIFVELLLGV